MTRKEFLDNYWRLYILLEKRFVKSLSYVELCQDNMDTYSIEFISQLREIGSEIDIIMKELCGFNQDERKGIDNYASIILMSYPDIVNQVVTAKDIGINPFENWSISSPAQSLPWWEAYNHTKHGRVLNFKEGSLQNVFYALGALFVLNNYLLKKIADENNDIDVVNETSSIFVMKNWQTRFENLSETYYEIMD